MPASDDRKRSKTDALAEDGTLNPAPEKVRDPKFQEDGFFDPRDIVQVKYEMLRRASVEKASVTDVSDEYGVSRPTYYQAKADFEEGGIAGLVPRKRGPRGPHKIQGEVSGVHRGADFSWRPDTGARSGEVAPEGTRPRCPSTNDRTGGPCKKNSEMTGAAVNRGRASGRHRRPLREVALGHARRSAAPRRPKRADRSFCTAACGDGLRMSPVETAKLEPVPSRSLAPAQVIERRAIICLLAGMAMAINDRRTP